MNFPPISILLDLQRPGTLRSLYDDFTLNSTAPGLRRLRTLAGVLASVRPSFGLNGRRHRPWQASTGCDHLPRRA